MIGLDAGGESKAKNPFSGAMNAGAGGKPFLHVLVQREQEKHQAEGDPVVVAQIAEDKGDPFAGWENLNLTEGIIVIANSLFPLEGENRQEERESMFEKWIKVVKFIYAENCRGKLAWLFTSWVLFVDFVHGGERADRSPPARHELFLWVADRFQAAWEKLHQAQNANKSNS